MGLKLSRGYTPVREKVTKSAKYMRECGNCQYFDQAEGDEEEVCQNPQVLEFDICVEGNRVFCVFWRCTGS